MCWQMMLCWQLLLSVAVLAAVAVCCCAGSCCCLLLCWQLLLCCYGACQQLSGSLTSLQPRLPQQPSTFRPTSLLTNAALHSLALPGRSLRTVVMPPCTTCISSIVFFLSNNDTNEYHLYRIERAVYWPERWKQRERERVIPSCAALVLGYTFDNV